MTFYVVNCKLEDFDKWKKVYDSFEPTREKYGVKERYVIQSIEDANTVVVIGEGDLESVTRFLGSEDLKNGMGEAGVLGPPDIYIGENI